MYCVRLGSSCTDTMGVSGFDSHVKWECRTNKCIWDASGTNHTVIINSYCAERFVFIFYVLFFIFGVYVWVRIVIFTMFAFHIKILHAHQI